MTERKFRIGAAVLAGAVLLTGATWRGLAAGPSGAAPGHQATATAATPAIAHAIAGGRDSYADIVSVVSPAVVTVRVEGKARVSPTGFDGSGDADDLLRRFFGDQPGGQPRMPRAPKQHGLGSGVIVSTDGYILTNHHVVDGATDIDVDFTDGRTLKGKLVGTDKASDLAVLKVDATNLKALSLGNSDGVQVGDVVLAVGNPLGIGQTVTMGIISAKGRSTGVGDGSYEDFLQTDAPINHGNSGGALVNTRGELVGINSQIVSVSEGNIGIGFAIPANMARHVMDDLRTSGRVRRSRMGVTIQPVTSDMAASLGLKEVGGAIISSVEAGGAAERAGLKRGDVITSFDGQPVRDWNAMRNRVADTAPGSAASVTVIRDGREKTLKVTLEEASPAKSARNEQEGEGDDKAALGVSVAPVTPELASRAGLPKDVRGVIVQDVNPDGRAADAGIKAGDVIQEVNRTPVETIDALRAAVRQVKDRPLLLLVSRQGKDLYVTVRPS